MIACKHGHTALVKFILSRGAEINIADNKGMTAVKNAELTNKAELIELFQEYVDLNLTLIIPIFENISSQL